MDTLLILLGVLGFGAVIIAVHLFSVDGAASGAHGSDVAMGLSLVERSGGDRRSGREVVFPLLVNEMAIPQERRLLPERRRTVG